jgi:hypothetical protein
LRAHEFLLAKEEKKKGREGNERKGDAFFLGLKGERACEVKNPREPQPPT